MVAFITPPSFVSTKIEPFIDETLAIFRFESASPVDGLNYRVPNECGGIVVSNLLGGPNQIPTTRPKFGSRSLLGTKSDIYYGFVALTSTGADVISGTDYTVEGWFYPTSRNSVSDSYIYVKTDKTNYTLTTLSNGVMRLAATSIGSYTQNTLVTSSTAIPLNAWHHVALVRSGSTLRLFVDGALIGSATALATSEPVYIIYFCASEIYQPYFNGYLDEVRITAAARYSENFSVPTTEFPAP